MWKKLNNLEGKQVLSMTPDLGFGECGIRSNSDGAVPGKGPAFRWQFVGSQVSSTFMYYKVDIWPSKELPYITFKNLERASLRPFSCYQRDSLLRFYLLLCFLALDFRLRRINAEFGWRFCS